MAKTHFSPSGANQWMADRWYHYGRPVGNIFYVSATTGTDSSGYGFSPESPVATIDYAIGLCSADNGDLIAVMPGDTQTVTGAAGIAADVAGVKIVGMGTGRQRAIINFTTATGASCDVTAARVSFENLTFTNGIDAQTAMVNVQAADCTITNCEFDFANSSTQAALAVLTTAAANRLRIENCHFHGTTDAGTATAIRIVGGTDIVIQNNVILGAFTTSLGGIENNTTACTNTVIAGNLIGNQTASSTKAIVLASGATGYVINNRLQILSGTAPITAAAGYVGGNYYVAAAGVTAGTLV